MGKVKCDMVPKVNGEGSILYQDLLKKIQNRPLTNLIYACYLQQGVAAEMSKQGFKINKQGQHDSNAVYQFFDVASIKNESKKLSNIARQIGATDNLGNLVDFTDSANALQRVIQANSTATATVSHLVKKGDVFNIITEARDARTEGKILKMEKAQSVWEVLHQAFSTKGIDLNSFNFNRALVNALEGKNFLGWLENLKLTRNNLYSQRDIRTILAMDENSTQVTRLKSMYGSLDEVAAKVYEALHGAPGYTQGQLTLMNSALDTCKNLQGIDVTALRQQVTQIENNFDINSNISTNIDISEIEVQKTLKELNDKYGIDVNEIFRELNAPITTLSDAAAEAVITLKRQLNKLKTEQGITPESKQLETSINHLLHEIANQKYYIGILGFLNDASSQIQSMEALLQQSYSASGTNIQRSKSRAQALLEIKHIMEGYKHIVKALSNMDSIISNENISSYDKSVIENKAKLLNEYFERYESKIADIAQETMIDIASEYLGPETSNGMAIADIVSMAQGDSSMYDYLYSIGRVSNPLIATMGNIIRDAQGERTKRLAEISIRIRQATNKLYKSGSNTEFMYEPDSNYIISDIDWVSYKKAQSKAYAKFSRQGLKGLALEQAKEQWQEDNTEDKVVDYTNGRTERVPNSNYRKAFPTLTPAQQEYYNEVMQIKGELGSLLPSYAQKHYLPPQKRRSFIDAIVASKGNPKAIAKAILTKLKDLITIREDDTINTRNGIIIEGEEYGIKNGALDNTPYRQIPTFFINRIEDQGELLKDFSGALQALAGTAINYYCMNNIKDLVEFMGDFIKSREIPPKKNGIDVIINKGIAVYKQLRGYAKASTTEAIVDGFIEKHLYGVKLNDVHKWTKLAQSLLTYTSLRSLAVNVKGAISNYLVGEIQMLIESGAGEFYNPLDYMWAHIKVFGDNTVNAPGRIMDFITNNVNSLSVLLAERFDPLNEQFSEQSKARYHKGILRHLLSKDFSFIGYGMGEHMIHFVTMYAVLHNTKVKINGKDTTLYDAFYKSDKIDGNSELKLKDNVTYKDKNGNWVEVDEAFLDSIRDRIRYCNQTTHGSMNEEDKGLIHQKMLGRFAMNLRQWMVEHYSRRFRVSHWDASLNQYREGYYNTVGKFMLSWANDLFKFESEVALKWKDMNEGQKSNCRRALAEQLILACLLCLSFGLGEPEDHKKEFWTRMWIYQTKRAIMDVRGSTPYGVPMEMTKLLNSPVAATNTVNSLLYPFVGLPDINKTIQSGNYKGWNKYGKNMLVRTVPFWNQIDQLQHMDEDASVFTVFNDTGR